MGLFVSGVNRKARLRRNWDFVECFVRFYADWNFFVFQEELEYEATHETRDAAAVAMDYLISEKSCVSFDLFI